MYLSRLEVRNFRNLRDFGAPLVPGLNVVLGENNIGKTNLLDAIRVALGPIAVVGELPRLTADDIHRDKEGSRTTAPIRIDLFFSDLSREDQAQCIELLNYNAEKPAESTASIHFEATWNPKTERFANRRWGGDRPETEAAVPEDVLQAIPIVLLNALRDALSGLVGGRHSRLGHLLTTSAKKEDQSELESIARDANKRLEDAELVKRVQEKIQVAMDGACGPTLTQKTAIRTSEPRFERIANNLRLVIRLLAAEQTTEEFIEELHANGLGYNNLLYIATVLSELEAIPEASLPLLLVEEPEAHLHPQLQTMLGTFLARPTSAPGKSPLQTIVTSHSPTVAAHVQPTTIRVMHRAPQGTLRCVGIDQCGLTTPEQSQLRRLLDVTRATLLFSRGVILVEGISEALLVPVLARRKGIQLEERAISVVPVYGVDFATLAKLFGDKKIELPVAILTDGDPGETKSPSDDLTYPKRTPDGAEFETSDRVTRLVEDLKSNTVVKVFKSQVTLEYDLAAAGERNAEMMAAVWEGLFERTPRKLTRKIIQDCGEDLSEKAVRVWNGISLSSAGRRKAEFAQRFAQLLDDSSGEIGDIAKTELVVPQYIVDAISHVTGE